MNSNNNNCRAAEEPAVLASLRRHMQSLRFEDDAGDMFLMISVDGTVALRPNMHIDEVALAFWAAVAKTFPQWREAALQPERSAP